MNTHPGRFSGAAIALIWLLSGCATVSAPKSGADLVSEAKTKITEVQPAEVAAAGPAPIIIDVREPSEYRAGHIPGAFNVPRGVLEFRLDEIEPLKSLSEDQRLSQPLVLYCRSGGRAALATATLQQMGYTNARSIAGGFKAWRKAELPSEKPAEKRAD